VGQTIKDTDRGPIDIAKNMDTTGLAKYCSAIFTAIFESVIFAVNPNLILGWVYTDVSNL
jgi:hypothetical protein